MQAKAKNHNIVRLGEGATAMDRDFVLLIEQTNAYGPLDFISCVATGRLLAWLIHHQCVALRLLCASCCCLQARAPWSRSISTRTASSAARAWPSRHAHRPFTLQWQSVSLRCAVQVTFCERPMPMAEVMAEDLVTTLSLCAGITSFADHSTRVWWLDLLSVLRADFPGGHLGIDGRRRHAQHAGDPADLPAIAARKVTQFVTSCYRNSLGPLDRSIVACLLAYAGAASTSSRSATRSSSSS